MVVCNVIRVCWLSLTGCSFCAKQKKTLPERSVPLQFCSPFIQVKTLLELIWERMYILCFLDDVRRKFLSLLWLIVY